MIFPKHRALGRIQLITLSCQMVMVEPKILFILLPSWPSLASPGAAPEHAPLFSLYEI